MVTKLNPIIYPIVKYVMRQEYLGKEWKEEMDSCLNSVHGKSKGKDFCAPKERYGMNIQSSHSGLKYQKCAIF